MQNAEIRSFHKTAFSFNVNKNYIGEAKLSFQPTDKFSSMKNTLHSINCLDHRFKKTETQGEKRA